MRQPTPPFFRLDNWKLVVPICFIIATIIVIVLEVVVGGFTPATRSTTTQPIPPATVEPVQKAAPRETPATRFNCRDLELEFRNMEVLGYETALMHVSNVMALEDGGLVYYTAGDAERELQRCGVIP